MSQFHRILAPSGGLLAAVVVALGVTPVAAQAPQKAPPSQAQAKSQAQQPPQAPAQPGQEPVDGITGVWIDDEGKGGIEISRCGNRLCGHIVWLKDPVGPGGKPLTDGNNPEKALRKRPICGLQIIGDLREIGKGVWDKGWIYDPEEGKRYDVELRAKDGSRLQVHGYMGMKVLGETMVWSRAQGNLERCTPPQP